MNQEYEQADFLQQKQKWNLKAIKREFKSQKQLWIITAILLIWVAIFAYFPMYGLIISFQNYMPGKSMFVDVDWAGFNGW